MFLSVAVGICPSLGLLRHGRDNLKQRVMTYPACPDTSGLSKARFKWAGAASNSETGSGIRADMMFSAAIPRASLHLLWNEHGLRI